MRKFLDWFRGTSKENKIIFVAAVLSVIIVVGAIFITLQEVGVGVGVGNVPPRILSVSLKDTNENPVTELDPFTEYYLYVSVSEDNTLLDIEALKVIMYSPQATETSPDSEADHYTFIYNATTGSWIEGVQDTIILPDCVVPADLTVASGTYRLAFRLKLARATSPIADQWTLKVIVFDDNGTNDTYIMNFDVGVYAQIALSANQISFYGKPGDTKVPSSPQYITVTVYANWLWELLIRGTNLTSAEASIPVSNIFIDDDPNPTEATESGANIQALTETFQTALGQSGGYANGLEINIYFYIDIPSPLPSGTYTGKIYFALSVG